VQCKSGKKKRNKSEKKRTIIQAFFPGSPAPLRQSETFLSGYQGQPCSLCVPAGIPQIRRFSASGIVSLIITILIKACVAAILLWIYVSIIFLALNNGWNLGDYVALRSILFGVIFLGAVGLMSFYSMSRMLLEHGNIYHHVRYDWSAAMLCLVAHAGLLDEVRPRVPAGRSPSHKSQVAVTSHKWLGRVEARSTSRVTEGMAASCFPMQTSATPPLSPLVCPGCYGTVSGAGS